VQARTNRGGRVYEEEELENVIFLFKIYQKIRSQGFYL
jgi:hypothetical protein